MGGKTGTTTSSVSIPKEVMARYNAVNAYASDVAQTPFQGYQGQFVAGLTPTQQAGIQGTNQYAQSAQPYYQAATQQLMGAQQSALPGISAAYQNVGGAQDIGSQYAQQATQGIGAALQGAQPYQAGATQAAMMGAQQLGPENLNIQGYMNPYTQAVAAPTYQALQQQQQEQMAGQLGNAIRSGAFGGDRAALAAANLARQQQLGMAQAMAPIYQQGYGQALGTATQMGLSNRQALQNLASQLQGIGQQGYGQQMGAAQQLGALGQQQYGQGLGAAQQLSSLAQQGYGMGSATAQQLAALGQGAQQSGLQGAQAQMGAGTLEQQTQQADLTARYQQFLQERGYPFQVAQFLANIAMGTGALSGSTTTTQQPMPFFSDRRVKHDVKEIGKTHDGQPIYSFKYNGDNATQIGLMAQDVEKKHPDAVGEYGGVKTVDYKKATEGAERAERYEGGLVPASQGGAVTEPGAYERGGYDVGGGVIDPNDMQALLSQQQQALGPFGEKGIYGQSHVEAQPFGKAKGIIPQSRLHVPKLMQPKTPPQQQLQGIGGQALDAYDQAKRMYGRYQEAQGLWDKLTSKSPAADGQGGIGSDAVAAVADKDKQTSLLSLLGFSEGGLVPRKHFVKGGTAFHDPYSEYDPEEGQVPKEVLEIEEGPELAKTQTPSQSGSSGSGLGTALSLGKTILSFLPLKDGGIASRHGYATKGFVYDPTQSGSDTTNLLSTDMSPVEELNKEDVYSKGLNPAVAPRMRQFEKIARAEGAKGIKPGEMERSPETQASYDLTMPEGAPRAKPYSSGHQYRLATDFSGVGESDIPAMEKAAAKTGLTLGAKFSNPDIPHVQYGKGSFGGLYPEYGSEIKVGPGFGEAEHSGQVPEEARAAAYDKARALLASKGIDPESPKGQNAMSGLMSYLKENQAWLTPLGAGIRGMVQSKSPFLGGALLEGIGTGLEAVGPAQKAIADISQTVANAESIRAGIPSKALNEDGSINVVDEEGNVFTLDPAEFQIRRRRGEKIFPYMGKKAGAVAPKGLAGAAAEATAAPTATGVPSATTPTETGVPAKGKYVINDPMALNTQEQQGIQNEFQTLYGKYPTGSEDKLKQDRVNLRNVVNASGAAAELQRRNVTYADILSSRGQKGIFTGGPFAEGLAGLAASLNQASQTMGGSGFKPSQNATIEDAQKLYSQLIEQAQAAKDGKTLGELQNVAKTYPFITATGPGAAKTMAEVIVQSQEPIYKAHLASNMLASTGPAGQYDIRGEYVGGDFERTFRDKFTKIASEDKKAIEKLLSMQSGQFERDDKGMPDYNRPISMFSYLARQNQLPADIAQRLAKDFANGDTRIFSYFPNLTITSQ